jgi:aminopeptidase N
VPSLLRGFSAPVQLEFEYTRKDLTLLAAHDSDPVGRWSAVQRSFCNAILGEAKRHAAGLPLALDRTVVAIVETLVNDRTSDPALIALALAPPDFAYLAGLTETIDIDALGFARDFVVRELARALRPSFLHGFTSRRPAAAYAPTQEQIGTRALRNRCLAYLGTQDDDAVRALAVAQFNGADNMTDAVAALAAISHSRAPEREALFARFEARWRDEPLVLDKWFVLQATSQRADTRQRVEALLSHPKFSVTNPNRVRSLLVAFALHNWQAFHAADGGGYALVAGQVIALDRVNPHVSSLLAAAFNHWRRFAGPRRGRQRSALERIAAESGLSPDVREIVTRNLAE